MARPGVMHRFYVSKKWHSVRRQVIHRAKGLCELCGMPGNTVHHIKHINEANVSNVNVSLNLDNLMLLCTDCHADEHAHTDEIRRGLKFTKAGDLVER
jgi:5-methylcytosine-specific restriction endonuclease McrA